MKKEELPKDCLGKRVEFIFKGEKHTGLVELVFPHALVIKRDGENHRGTFETDFITECIIMK